MDREGWRHAAGRRRRIQIELACFHFGRRPGPAPCTGGQAQQWRGLPAGRIMAADDLITSLRSRRRQTDSVAPGAGIFRADLEAISRSSAAGAKSTARRRLDNGQPLNQVLRLVAFKPPSGLIGQTALLCAVAPVRAPVWWPVGRPEVARTPLY